MVYIFKTSVKTKKKAKVVAAHLNCIVKIDKWNFDFQDCDNILRIEAKNLKPLIIITLLKSLDFDCTEL